MNRWCAEGFFFDTGPTLLTMPEALHRLFADLGERLEDYLQIRPLDPHAEYVFPGGSRVAVPAGWDDWLRAASEIAPGDAEGLRRLHEVGRRIYVISSETFFRHHPLAATSLPSWRTLRELPLRYAWGNYARVVSRLLGDGRLRRIYLRYPTYVGSSPYRCPATLLVIPFLEHYTGVWFVRGGMYRIVEALTRLAERMGVQMRTGEQATAIEHEHGRVRAVELGDGVRLATDVIVYTGDSATLPLLLGGRVRATAASRSLSGLVLLLGLKEKLAGLHRHTVFFSGNYYEGVRGSVCAEAFPTRSHRLHARARRSRSCAGWRPGALRNGERARGSSRLLGRQRGKASSGGRLRAAGALRPAGPAPAHRGHGPLASRPHGCPVPRPRRRDLR